MLEIIFDSLITTIASRMQPSTTSRRSIITSLVLSIAILTTTSSSSVVAFVPASAASSLSPSLREAYIDEQYPPSSISASTNDDQIEASSSSSHIRTPTTSSTSSSSPIVQREQHRPPKVHPITGGRISLVGAGPGSPELLTVAAYRIISDPTNLFIVDRLVSEEILSLIKGEIKIANKHPGCADTAQREIYDWCATGVARGQHVVRLKIGDPFVFGRGGEEVLEFRHKCGVEPVVVPGVSAAFSAPLLGSIPVTHRGISNQVVMCTGYGRDNSSPELIQYHKEQTAVFLMAVGRLRSLCQNLVTMAGYPVVTPVAIVERAGCPDQRTVVGTIDTIADLAERYDVKPPSTIVVGEVVNVLLTEGDFVVEEYADESENNGARIRRIERQGLLIQANVD